MRGLVNLYIVFFLLFSCPLLFGQGQTVHWYFGENAALSFYGSDPNLLTDSQMSAPAGSSSISDFNGNLMFYTDGNTVWNRNHVIMDNGEDLAGQVDNLQSSIIIPKPGDPNTYYIFTTRTDNGTNPTIAKGVYYSTVQFSPGNPLGIITEKNTRIVNASSAEKITATHSSDGRSIWLIALTGSHTSQDDPKNTFSVFAIDQNGVSGTPIQFTTTHDIPSLGQMTVSIPGDKIAISGNSAEPESRFIYLYDFDNATGQITEGVNLLPDPTIGVSPIPIGLEFSPDGKYLYFSHTNASETSTGIIQVDVGGAIFGNKVQISNAPGPIIYGALQVSNDQKIYVAHVNNDGTGERAIGVIHNPNGEGLESNFEANAIRLFPNASRRALPNFIQSYFATKINTENACVNAPFDFTVESYAQIQSVQWDFGDGNGSSDTAPSHAYATAGEYLVRATMMVAGSPVVAFKQVTVYELPNLIPNQELVQCDDDMDGLSTFNLFNIREKITDPLLNEELFFYTSATDAQNDNDRIDTPDVYANTVPDQEIFVRVVNSNGCQEFTSFFVRANFVQVDPIAEMYTCELIDHEEPTPTGNFDLSQKRDLIRAELGLPNNATLTFFETLTNAQTVTDELPDSYDSDSKTIWVRISGPGNLNCGGLQSFDLIVNPKPIVTIDDKYFICMDPTVNPVILTADPNNQRVEWRDTNNNDQIVSTDRSFFLNQRGKFKLVAYNIVNGFECSNSQTFKVVYFNPPVIVSTEVMNESDGSFSVDVVVEGTSTYEFSIDGINFFGNGTSYTLTNVPLGFQTVYVRGLNNCEPQAEKEISVLGYPGFFTPNGDGINDTWNVKGVSDTYYKSINIRIFNRYGKAIFEINDFQSTGWDGNYNGKKLDPNDYWFTAEIIDLNDNVIKKSGNFSLLRGQ